MDGPGLIIYIVYWLSVGFRELGCDLAAATAGFFDVWAWPLRS